MVNTDEPLSIDPLEHVGRKLLPPTTTLCFDKLQASNVPDIASDVDFDVFQLNLQRELGVGQHVIPALHHEVVTRYRARPRVHATRVASSCPESLHGRQVAVPERVVEPGV